MNIYVHMMCLSHVCVCSEFAKAKYIFFAYFSLLSLYIFRLVLCGFAKTYIEIQYL